MLLIRKLGQEMDVRESILKQGNSMNEEIQCVILTLQIMVVLKIIRILINTSVSQTLKGEPQAEIPLVALYQSRITHEH